MCNQENKYIQLTAHRGIKGLIPENTLQSFKAALDLRVDVLEYDVHMTRDRELVIMHDSTVDRTTNSSGAINFMTLEEIKQIDAGIKFGEQFQGYRVPTLRETLDLFTSYDYLPEQIVEIKDFRPEVVDAVVSMLEEYRLTKRTIIEAGDAPTILYIQEKYPQIRTLVFAPSFMKRPIPKIYEKVYGVAISFMSPQFTSKGQIKELCEKYAAERKKLYLFNGDTAENIEECIGYGADNITTNFAPFAIKYLNDHGHRKADNL